MSIGDNIKQYRLENSLTLEDLANKIGTSKQTIHRYESGVICNIPSDKIELMASIFGVSPSKIMGWDSSISTENELINISNLYTPEFKKVPLLGTIACGEPILANQNIEDYVSCEISSNADFALKCKGDSMINANINNGDLVFIKQQPMVENGEIAAILIENEATLKRVYVSDNSITLQAENPNFPPLIYTNEDMNDVQIIGKAVAHLKFF